MSTIAEVYDPNKKPYGWCETTSDKSVKLADKLPGDGMKYAGTTKASVDEARYQENLHEFRDVVAIDLGGEKIPGILFIKTAKFIEEETLAFRSGKKSAAEVAKDVGVFVGTEIANHATKGVFHNPGVIAFTMMQMILRAVPKTFDAEKQDKQLFHDEAVRAHIAESLGKDLPDCTLKTASNGDSAFGRTYRNTVTFDNAQLAFKAALKENPAVEKDLHARCWHGKCAAFDLGIKSQAALTRALDPKNQDPRAIAFRDQWNNKNNVAWRLGVSAAIDEANSSDAKTKEMYASDLARFKAEQIAVDAKAVPVKS